MDIAGKGGTITDTFDQAIIGGDAQAAVDNFFNGTIDDVIIFNRSLSADEVLTLYSNASSKYLSLNFTGLSERSHSFTAYSQDLGGNVNSTSRSVTVDLPDITECKTLSTAGQSYTMANHITNNDLTGPCLNITADNIVLDCNNKYILSDDAFEAIYVGYVLNTTVKNCNVSTAGNALTTFSNNSNFSNIIASNSNYGLNIQGYYNFI